MTTFPTVHATKHHGLHRSFMTRIHWWNCGKSWLLSAYLPQGQTDVLWHHRIFEPRLAVRHISLGILNTFMIIYPSATHRRVILCGVTTSGINRPLFTVVDITVPPHPRHTSPHLAFYFIICFFYSAALCGLIFFITVFFYRLHSTSGVSGTGT